MPKSPHSSVVEFPDSQAAIDGFLDVWLPRIVKSNEILTAALVRVRDFYLAGAPAGAADDVVAEVDLALKKAAKAQNGT